MPSDHQPQAAVELKTCARHLVQRPLTCKEHDPDLFRLIRRHEAELDRWFTQRLGYRLHVDADTARLFKDSFVPARRPLQTMNHRPFHALEYVLLALVLGTTVAGPNVISLRDLVERVRSAAGEGGIALEDSATARRALVAVLKWMIELGIAVELHAGVDAYAGDERADAVLKVRPDRIALLPLPALAGAADASDLLARAERRSATRQWMRCRLVEDPVLYRTDLTEAEWSELRRRLGEEERLLEEMFGLVIEARAEGVAAIDPAGILAERRFPAVGTLAHAALLLIEKLHNEPAETFKGEEITRSVSELAEQYRRRWAGDLVEAPERLARQVTDWLVDLRLAEWVRPADALRGDTRMESDVQADNATDAHTRAHAQSDAHVEAGPSSGPSDTAVLRLLPAAARFLPAYSDGGGDARKAVPAQESLW